MPDELSRPPFPSEPKMGLTPVAVVERSPTGIALLPQYATRIALVLVAVAGVVVTLPSAGVPLPPAVIAIASAVLAIGTALGIASPGVRKAQGPAEVKDPTRGPQP